VKQKLIFTLAHYLGGLHAVKELTVVVSLENDGGMEEIA
jgi:hypothetical protein